MKKIACGCGILLLLIIIGAFLAWRFLGPPRPIASSVATTPEARARQKAAVQQLREQVETIHRQARQGAHAPFELRISETQLNALLAQGVEKGGKFDVQNLAARLEPDLLTLQGTANYHGTPVTLTLTGNLALVNSRIQFKAKSLWLGGFPAPDKWRDQASEFVSRQINSAITKDAGRLDEVKIQSGELVVRGVTR